MRRLLTSMLIALADLRPSSASAQSSCCERQAYEGVICEGSSVQQEAAPSCEIPISGAPACDRLQSYHLRTLADPTLPSAVHAVLAVGCV